MATSEDPEDEPRDAPAPPSPHADPWQGLNLRYWRKHRGMSLRGLAERSGIAYSTISTYERGIAQMPFDSACKLSRALEIPVPYIWNHQRPPGWQGEDPAELVEEI